MYLQKGISKKTRNFFCCLGRSLTEEQDPEPDPDPLVRNADPKIQIRPKMSEIRNTVEKNLIRHILYCTDTFRQKM